MNKGMILVCGVPRSGTSLCMDIQRMAHGEDAIVGKKFPRESEPIGQQENEPDHMYAIRTYIQDLQEKYREAQNENGIDKDRMKDMNPEGFWECPFTVRGIIYSPQMRKVLKEVLEGEKKICKVVCSGMLNSDPQYIDRIIFTLRDPHSVAKSQERLGRQFKFQEELKMHTPEMFIQNLVQASRFFLMYPDIPVMFYKFDDLIENPIPIINQMQEFIGFGDYSKAHDVIQPKLNRSKDHEHVKNGLFDDAEHIYELFCEKKYQEVIDYMSDAKIRTNREKMNWPCFRAGSHVNNILCNNCYNDRNATKNMLTGSAKRGVKWQDKPCFFECGMDVDREEYISIEESIANNFWEEVDYKEIYDIIYQKEVLQRMIDDDVKECEIKRQKDYIKLLEGKDDEDQG